MWWHYGLVFAGSLLVDSIPFPLPPAFVVMVILQVMYDLNIWGVIVVGVVGAAAGRYLLSLYVPRLFGRVFKPEKNEDVQFLGKKLIERGWKSQALILAYSLMPLPTLPLFIAGGMAKMKPYHILPAFVVGKLVSNSVAILTGQHAVHSFRDVTRGLSSWQSMTGLGLGLLLLLVLLIIDWRALLQRKKLTLNFRIWK